LAVSHSGAIVYQDTNGLTIGAVSENTQAAAATTTSVTNTASDLALILDAGNLRLANVVQLGTGSLSIDVANGTISQAAAITANGLQMQGAGASATLTNIGNNFTTFASSYTGAVSVFDSIT